MGEWDFMWSWILSAGHPEDVALGLAGHRQRVDEGLGVLLADVD